jgi:hypothetical protein
MKRGEEVDEEAASVHLGGPQLKKFVRVEPKSVR